MSVATLHIDVEEEYDNLERIEADDVRIIVTDKKYGLGMIGTFQTKGLRLETACKYLKYLLDTGLRTRDNLGLV